MAKKATRRFKGFDEGGSVTDTSRGAYANRDAVVRPAGYGRPFEKPVDLTPPQKARGGKVTKVAKKARR